MSTVISYKNIKITIPLLESEDHDYASSSTDHKIESGSTISDHIIHDPDQVLIKGFCSEITKDGVEDPHLKLLDSLYSAKISDELFTVETIAKTYNDMTLNKLSVSVKAGEGESLFLTLGFKKFNFTTAKETKAPKEKIEKKSQDRYSPKTSKGQVAKSTPNSNQASKTTNATKAVPNPNKAPQWDSPGIWVTKKLGI